MLLYVAVEGHSPLRRETALATLAAVLDAPIPPPVRSGRLAPALVAVLSRNPAARPDAAALDRMLAAAEHALADPAGSGRRPPTGYQPQPQTPRSRGSPRPDRTGTRRTAVIAGATVLGLLGVLSWILYSSALRTGHDAVSRTSAPATSQRTGVGRSPGSAVTAPPPAAVQDLLTPGGVRTAISGLRDVIGGTKFKTLVVYPTLAAAQAPTKTDRTVYDNYAYRDGTASDVSAGGALSSGDVLFDPTVFGWDALPGLIRTADTRLGVAHPAKHYIIVLGDFLGTGPALLVYVGDNYRTAYLVADTRGDVVRMYPYTPSSG
jgi:hypothetical protein